MEYFIDAADDQDVNQLIRFPILIYETYSGNYGNPSVDASSDSSGPIDAMQSRDATESHQVKQFYMPSYATVNLGAEEKSVEINQVCRRCLKDKSKCRRPHDWLLQTDMVRGVSLYKRDERCLNLYVHLNSDDFQMFFASEKMRKRFYDLVLEMTHADQIGISDFETAESSGPIPFEYDTDENGKKIILGKGTYGVVYAAHDTRTQVAIAIKEITIKNLNEVQPLEEEIRLHSQMRHRNVVQYLGSRCEDNRFKILMERVPGGSLSHLLCSKWGALKGLSSYRIMFIMCDNIS